MEAVKVSEIVGQERTHSVRKVCRTLEVSRSAYYARDKRQRKRRQKDEPLVEAVREIRKERFKNKYGPKRMHKELLSRGISCGRHRVTRVMRQYDLCPRKTKAFHTTTDSNHELTIAPNLLDRNFEVGDPNRAWLGDITYLGTERDGFVYLATIIDVGTRRWLGYAVADHMRAELCTEALSMALLHEGQSPSIIHHDRGSQYASTVYREMVEGCGAKLSMSRKGDCWDNAIGESVFSRFKEEVGDTFVDLADAKENVFAYYNFYDNERLHSSLGYMTPRDYAANLVAMGAAR